MRLAIICGFGVGMVLANVREPVLKHLLEVLRYQEVTNVFESIDLQSNVVLILLALGI